MKTLALVTAAALLPLSLSAADEKPEPRRDLRQLLQQGLFEEEANRDLGKAAAAYAELVSQYEAQRSLAGTALFRLAEIRAKEGNKAEAIALHQRFLAEFPSQEALVKLSKERLAQLGGAMPAAVDQADAPTDAEAKELLQLREMVRNSPDLLNARGGEGNVTPLFRAANNGWIAAASFLLDNGAAVNEGDGAALRAAAEQGHKRMVELLIQRGADVNAGHGNTALRAASEKNRLEVARVLLASGADPNVVGAGDFGTPLQAAISNGYEAMARLLLDHKADPNLSNEFGNSPLAAAIRIQSKPLVTELLARGADVNAPQAGGETVLHQAMGETVLHKTGGQTITPITTRPSWLEIVPQLLEHGASVNASIPQSSTLPDRRTVRGSVQQTGFTPLHSAMLARSQENLDGRIQVSGAVNVLTGATLKQLLATWDALLAKGAEINARDAMGRTPLSLAADRADLPVEALVWLVERGASVDAADKYGSTVFDYAQSVSPDRRLALEVRYRFPKWTAERAITALSICPEAYSAKPLTFEAVGEAASPPTTRDLLLRIVEELQGSPPIQFNLLIYRAEAEKEVTQFAKLALNVDAKFPETPELRWGDVLVLECGDQANSGHRSWRTVPDWKKKTVLQWLRSAQPSATPDPTDADKTPAEKSSTEGTQVQP